MKTYDTTQKWIKVSSDQTKDWPHKGPYRDDGRQVMHGVYEVKQKRIVKKYFINNGYKMAMYKYPDIKRSFSSPMVNDYNLHLCGGWSWRDVNERQEIVDRVIAGLKPTGFTYAFEKDREWLEQQESMAQQAGCSTCAYETHLLRLGVAYPHQCCEIFDLDALKTDYMKYAGILGGGYRFDDVEEALDVLCSYNFTNFFEEFAVGDPTSNSEAIVTGLLLGYPIESTVSIIDW